MTSANYTMTLSMWNYADNYNIARWIKFTGNSVIVVHKGEGLFIAERTENKQTEMLLTSHNTKCYNNQTDN